ncbi:MAG: hypothetical protein ACYDHY_06935 [Acidiferrobacterales bacterium]
MSFVRRHPVFCMVCLGAFLLFLGLPVLMVVGESSRGSDASGSPLPQATMVGEISLLQGRNGTVYRLEDGPNVCYLARGAEAVAISCLPKGAK